MAARLRPLLVAASLTIAACSGGGQGSDGTRPACPDVSSTVPPAAETAPPSGPLRADASGRFVLTADGRPFFWLGDTAWMMIGRASHAGVDRYLLDRHEKLFNVVQIWMPRHIEDAA